MARPLTENDAFQFVRYQADLEAAQTALEDARDAFHGYHFLRS